MSSTPYRDELLRIAAQLGLPDETDLTTLADWIAANLPSVADVQGLREWAGVPDETAGSGLLDHIVANVPRPAETVPALQSERITCAAHDLRRQAALELADEMEVRREKYGTGGAFADLSDLAQRLRAVMA